MSHETFPEVNDFTTEGLEGEIGVHHLVDSHLRTLKVNSFQ